MLKTTPTKRHQQQLTIWRLNLTVSATAKGNRCVENDTDEATSATVDDVVTSRTLATGRHSLRHRYRFDASHRLSTLRHLTKGHVNALQECGVQPLTQYSTVGASTFRGNIFLCRSTRFYSLFSVYLCILSQREIN